MRSFRNFSKLLMLIPLAMLIYDLVDQWFVHNMLYLRTFHEWLMWVDPTWAGIVRPFLAIFVAPNMVEKIMTAPGALVMFIPPFVMYILYRIIFALRGGQTAGTMTFRSHD